MNGVSVSALKNGLSAILHKVKNGREVVVTDHGHAIAIISPYTRAQKSSGDALLVELEVKGIAAPPKKRKIPAKTLEKTLLRARGSAVATLLKEREESAF